MAPTIKRGSVISPSEVLRKFGQKQKEPFLTLGNSGPSGFSSNRLRSFWRLPGGCEGPALGSAFELSEFCDACNFAIRFASGCISCEVLPLPSIPDINGSAR